MKKYVSIFDEERGQGLGVGGQRQGDGGAVNCVCSSCGYKEAHERGIPCIEKVCPKCGKPMRGE